MGLSIRDAQVDVPSGNADVLFGGTGGATGIAGSGGKLGTGGAAGALASAGASGTRGGAGGVLGMGGNVGTGGVVTAGTTGNSCYDSSGYIAASAKPCHDTGDCRIGFIPTCCGSDLAVGLARTVSCAFPVPDCSGLSCAKSIYMQAEDGQTTELGGSIMVECKRSLCTTYMTKAGGTGGIGGGGGANGGGGSSSAGGRDGSAGDAGTGACETDDDCIFRSEAGCCGMCLAVDDPVPPMIPCGAMCFGILNCACVDHRCTEGTLPRNSPCEPEHDLCQASTKCCALCSPYPLDGSSGCAAPVCTSATYGSDGVPHCPDPA